MLNRGAIILKYRKPLVRWINEADPVEGSREVLAESLEQDRHVYLVPVEAVADEVEVRRWIEANFGWQFEEELEGWCTDPSLWPQARTLQLFDEWFDVAHHSVILDTDDDDLVDEDD